MPSEDLTQMLVPFLGERTPKTIEVACSKRPDSDWSNGSEAQVAENSF